MQNVSNIHINVNEDKDKITIVKTVEETYTVEDIERRLRMIDREKKRVLERIDVLNTDYTTLVEEEMQLQSLLENTK